MGPPHKSAGRRAPVPACNFAPGEGLMGPTAREPKAQTPPRASEEKRRLSMNAPLKFGMASVLALATVSPALAQYQAAPQYQPQQYQQEPQYQQPAPQYQPTQPSLDAQQQYQRDRSDYEARKDAYDARKDAYDARRDSYEVNRSDYQAARADYERRRAQWERARADYDARHGYGTYIRVYGPAPIWDEGRYGRYEAPAAGYYGRPTTYNGPVTCRNDHSSATAGGILGALAGAALGSNVAARGHRGDGAVLGGIVGAGIGASVGNAHDRYRCDNRGPYFAYGDTIAYREAPDYRSGRYDYAYYSRMHCRLAPAPIDSYGRDYRYVRVCPDADGRYRITG
jgi:hypothetical protein